MTTLVNIDKFLPYVMPHASGVSEPTAEQAIRDSAIEFLSKTRLWRDWLQPVTLAADSELANLTIHADAELHRIEDLWLDRSPLEPMTEDGIRESRFLPGDRGAPRFYTSDGPGSIRLFPIPDREYLQMLRARVTLIPSQQATTLPEFLYKHYAREIADGALSRLHASSENYARPESLALYSSKYEAAIDRGISQAARSNTRSPRRARAHWF